MKLNKNIFTILEILAIFGMIMASSIVSAVEDADGSPNEDDAIIPPDINHDEEKMLNQTGSAGELTNITNTTDNTTNSTNLTVYNQHNTTNNTTGNATNNPAKLLTTGNPIFLILLALFAAAGLYANKKMK